jgi:radical SAM family RiPP maturation amino acid epimerase
MTELKNNYRQIFSNKTPQELHDLARIKRFMERLTADGEFRKALSENVDDPFPIAKQFGIEIDPLALLPLWHRNYLKYRNDPSLSDRKWPLAEVWDTHIKTILKHRDALVGQGASQINSKLNAWRERQIKRCNSELGNSAMSIVHPLVAYELSQGCSVGCWFCGISAESFKGSFSYSDENAQLWLGVLEQSLAIMGPAASTGFCYWATDPCDNPEYDRFLEDYHKVFGVLPQTTTAIPLKNIALTKRIMALHEKYMSIPNRFSVLTVGMLDKIHEAFTPDELLCTELVVQTKTSLLTKAVAGKALEKYKKHQNKELNAPKSDAVKSGAELDHSTIACVSGFLVNMVSKTVELIAPTRASEAWPKGYRIYGSRRFNSAQEYGQAITELIDSCMPQSVTGDTVLSFRGDLLYFATAQGYVLEGKYQKFTFAGFPFAKRMGELIQGATLTADEVLGELIADGADIFVALKAIQELHDLSVLNDDPASKGSKFREYRLAAV